MEDVLYKLIATVEEVAPHVWEIAVRQAYVEGITNLLGTLFSVAALVVCIRVFLWGKVRIDEDEWEVPTPVFAVVVGVSGMILLPIAIYASLTSAIANFLNPEFAAIKLLLKVAGVQ